jgi:predicted CoA-binding protein
MIVTTAAQRRSLIDDSRRIAIVGASANQGRASYFVFRYMLTRGRFEVLPINPTLTAIDGIECFPDLAAYAAVHGSPDIVDVFRKPSEALGVTRDAIAVKATAIWYQYGVVNEEAIALADQAGLLVVVDRCLKVETARFDGGLAMGGLNTGLIHSRRRIS